MLENLIRENVLLLSQGERFLATLSDSAFCAENPEKGVSSIGRHFRHITNHYEALLSAREGRIDYETRERGSEMETIRSLALAKVADLKAGLGRLPTGIGDQPLVVERLSANENGEVKLAALRSSFARELEFAHQHTTHHYAVIRLIAAQHGFLSLPDFGMSPATLRYLATPRV